MCRSELPHSVQRFLYIFGKVADTEEQMWNWLIIMFIQYHEAIFQFFFLSILFLISDQHHIHPHSILVGGKNVTYVSVPMIPEVAPPPLMQRHIINIVTAKLPSWSFLSPCHGRYLSGTQHEHQQQFQPLNVMCPKPFVLTWTQKRKYQDEQEASVFNIGIPLSADEDNAHKPMNKHIVLLPLIAMNRIHWILISRTIRQARKVVPWPLLKLSMHCSVKVVLGKPLGF